jgi:hypothetical protein
MACDEKIALDSLHVRRRWTAEEVGHDPMWN